MGDWDVVSEAPVAAAPANPWQVVSEAPAPPQGRGIWQAIKDYPAHFATSMLEQAKKPGEALNATAENPMTSEAAVEAAVPLAMMGGVKMGKTVGKGGAVTPEERARIAEKPVEAPVALEWKPVSETPIVAEPVKPAEVPEPPHPGEPPSPWSFKDDNAYNAANRAYNEANRARGEWETAQRKKEAASPPVEFHDTRGLGQQYHGTPNPGLEVDQWHSASKNYYGSGFYTTDAVDIAHGYTKRKGRVGDGSVHTVTPAKDVKVFNMEEPIPEWLKKAVPDDGSEFNNYIHSALEGDLEGRVPKNTRELYDDIRNNSAGEGYSADTVQEIFDQLRYHVEQQGYEAMEHQGGLLTKKTPHKVIIYFDPTQVKINPVDRKVFAKPVAVEPAKPPPLPLETPKPAEPPPLPEPTPKEMNSAQRAARKLKEIFTPEDVSDVSKGAGMDVRAASGKGARDTEVTRSLFDEFAPKLNKISEPDKLALIDYIEGRSKGVPLADKTLQPFADVFRGEMKYREKKLSELKSVTKEEFIEDYFPHMWKDPAKAESFAREFYNGSGKQGSGASLKARTMPTIRDGIAAGLEPVTTDPVQIGMKYVTSMDHFIGAQQILEKAKADGNVKYIRPKVMGASGNPEGFSGAPPGWEPLKGRGSTNAQGAQAYAPADYARIYNNYIDKGWNNSKTWGPVLDSVQRTSNAITSLKLGLSGFHAATMAKEAFASGLDRAVAQLASGQPLKAAVSVAVAPTKFIQNAVRGREFKDVYLGKEKGTPLMNQVVDLLTEAGGRGAGNRHAADYRYSAMDSYWNAWKRGSIKAEIKAAAAESKQAYGLGSIKVLAQQVGRTMQTVAKPLFEHYIPNLKNGAAYDMMSAWLDANPKATKTEQLRAARKVVDEVDNRFGEMIQDNIFWNKTMKQSLQTAMLSYSWFLGTARTIGGGTAALARNPARLSMKHPDWKPNANYALALPFVVATANAFYQYLKTGTTPDDVHDLMAPETGGMVKGSGGQQVKERGQTPGYEKDVFGWLHSPKDEAFNKLSGIIQIPYYMARNKDWKDQPIRHAGAPAMEQVAQVLNYIYEQLKPISVAKLSEGQKKGSNITKGETVLGIKNAPAHLQDPEGSSKVGKYFSDKDWRKREQWERSHKRNYE